MLHPNQIDRDYAEKIAKAMGWNDVGFPLEQPRAAAIQLSGMVLQLLGRVEKLESAGDMTASRRDAVKAYRVRIIKETVRWCLDIVRVIVKARGVEISEEDLDDLVSEIEIACQAEFGVVPGRVHSGYGVSHDLL